MQVVVTPSFNKDISKIRDSQLIVRIQQIITKMQSAKTINDISGVKRLSGSSDSYRVRIGDYRLGFTCINNTIRLVIFAHRKEIYRYFP